MRNDLLIDNWKLQDASVCLRDGLASETVFTQILIDAKAGIHSWLPVPYAATQLEALFSLILEAVLCDSLIVDAAYCHVWKTTGTPIDLFEQEGLIEPRPFDHSNSRIHFDKTAVIDRLCLTKSLRERKDTVSPVYELNVLGEDAHFSQVLWGTASYLSHSHIWGVPYSGHPDRCRLLDQTMFCAPQTNVVSCTVNWIMSNRDRLFQEITPSMERRGTMIFLPPIVVEVIQQSSDLRDLFPTAIQLRSKYSSFRKWLGQYRTALDDQEPLGLLKYKKVLASVAQEVDRTLGKLKDSSSTLKFSIEWLNLSIPIPDLRKIVQRLGIRVVMNQ